MPPDASPSQTAAPHIVIIGSGFGGLGMAIQLKKAGIESFTVLEKAGSVGGTWRDNTYPGAACDIPSHLYSFSFAPKADWSRKYGLQSEIRAYLEACVDTYGLRPHIRFDTEVAAAVFDEAHAIWRLTTAGGEQLQARIVITACGQLNRPAYPQIDGMAGFEGEAFHSSRWNHAAELRGKKVAVIGTGASAIQFVPQLAPQVAQLSIFQRDGAWVIPKPDRPFNRIEQWLFQHSHLADRAYRTLIYWMLESRALAFTRFGWLLEVIAWQSRWMAWRAVKDPAKRSQLIPRYKIGCKRVLISNDWFPAVNHDHVHVVTERIARIETDAIVTHDGVRHPVDAIIYGTGFQVTDFLAPMKITGVNGLDLNQAWREGAEAYKGISVAGFPNFFMLYGPNTNLAHSSIIFMLESQIRYVMLCVRTLLDPALGSMDVKASRQQAYAARIQQRIKRSVWEAGCNSWYKTAAGKNTVNWPGFTFGFRRMTSTLDLSDYELHPRARP